MSNKKLIILALTAVIMVILAVAQSRLANKPASRTNVLAELIQGLNPDKIDKIIVSRGQTSAALERSGNGFVITDFGNYPADPEAINSVITMCLDVRTSQLYTDNPDNFRDLWLTEDEARNVIKFYNGSNLLTAVVVGKAREKDQSTYVRLLSDDKAYITYNEFDLKSRPIDFVDKTLISMEPGEIESVTVKLPDEQYEIRWENEKAVLQNVPAGKKADESKCDAVFEALSSLSFENVKPIADAGKDLVFDSHLTCRLKNETVYNVDIARKDDKTFVKCIAEFTGSEKVQITKTESEEELKKKEAQLLASDKAKEFTKKHSSWVYQIPSYEAENLTKSLSELTEDLPKPEPAGANAPDSEPNQPKAD